MVALAAGLLVATGAVLFAERLGRKLHHDDNASGNVFFILFGAIILLGGIGQVFTAIITGPAQGVGQITRRTMSEVDLAAAAQILVATARNMVGDCDGDDYVEPLPWRDPGGAAAPAGGGLIPDETVAATRDKWNRPIGYCAWDHGPSSVADDNPGCGGNAARRMQGGDLKTEYVMALISAGADGVFSTRCNAFLDGNGDSVPDMPLVEKTPGTDDIVLPYTYGEAFASGDAGATGTLTSMPDEACTPTTMGLLRDELGTVQVCTSAGWQEVGAAVAGSGNFTPVTGAALNSAHTSNEISFTGFFGTRTASVDNGAIILVNGTPQGATAEVAVNDLISLQASAAAGPEVTTTFTLSISALKRAWTITTRDKLPPVLSLTPASQAGMDVVGPGNPAYGSHVVFALTNTGEAATAFMQPAVLSNPMHFEFYVGGGHLGDNCNGRSLAGGDSCQIAVRPRASDDGALNATLNVSDGTFDDSALLSGNAAGWGCSVAAGTTWNVSGSICTVPTTLSIAHGSTAIATDATAPTTGSATYSCHEGVHTRQPGATCAAE